MDSKSLKKLAAVSAVALGTAMYVGNVTAAPVQSGTAVGMTMTGIVLNTIDVAITDLNFGTVGAIAKNANQAEATLDPDGTWTDDPSTTITDARIVADPDNAPTVGELDIDAFPNTPLSFVYAVADNTLQIGGGGNPIILQELNDNLDTVNGGGGTAGGYENGVGVTNGSATTDGSGDLTMSIGGVIRTQSGNGDYVYVNGAYTTSFTVTISY